MLENLCGECIGLLGLAQCTTMLEKHDDDDDDDDPASHSNTLRTHVAASLSALTPDQVLIMLTKGCHFAARYQVGGGGDPGASARRHGTPEQLTHLPVLSVVGGDGDVANGRIKPDVENLLLVARARHARAPLQVARDAAQLQAIPHPCVRRLRTACYRQSLPIQVTIWSLQACGVKSGRHEAAARLIAGAMRFTCSQPVYIGVSPATCLDVEDRGQLNGAGAAQRR